MAGALPTARRAKMETRTRSMIGRKRVLILCIGNSAHCRTDDDPLCLEAGDRFEVGNAGTKAMYLAAGGDRYEAAWAGCPSFIRIRLIARLVR